MPSQATFPRRLRLTTPQHYAAVFKQGQRGRTAYLGIIACANTLDYPRLGLAVSRKVSTKAVIRNRIKRIARDVFRHRQDSYGGVDLIVVAYPPAASATRKELARALVDLSAKMCKTCVKS